MKICQKINLLMPWWCVDLDKNSSSWMENQISLIFWLILGLKAGFSFIYDHDNFQHDNDTENNTDDRSVWHRILQNINDLCITEGCVSTSRQRTLSMHVWELKSQTCRILLQQIQFAVMMMLYNFLTWRLCMVQVFHFLLCEHDSKRMLVTCPLVIVTILMIFLITEQTVLLWRVWWQRRILIGCVIS